MGFNKKYLLLFAGLSLALYSLQPIRQSLKNSRQKIFKDVVEERTYYHKSRAFKKSSQKENFTARKEIDAKKEVSLSEEINNFIQKARKMRNYDVLMENSLPTLFFMFHPHGGNRGYSNINEEKRFVEHIKKLIETSGWPSESFKSNLYIKVRKEDKLPCLADCVDITIMGSLGAYLVENFIGGRESAVLKNKEFIINPVRALFRQPLMSIIDYASLKGIEPSEYEYKFLQEAFFRLKTVFKSAGIAVNLEKLKKNELPQLIERYKVHVNVEDVEKLKAFVEKIHP